MAEQRTVVVSRDVPARKVPDGTRITIPKNSFVNLRQALGGTYTVTINGNMARPMSRAAQAHFESQFHA